MTFQQLTKTITNRLKTLEGDISLSIKFLATNETYNYQEKVRHWAASTIKVPIALSFYAKVAESSINISDRTTITKGNVVLGSGIIKLLDEENKYTYRDLLTLMLVVSDNTAANEIIDSIGTKHIENYLRNIDMVNTTFKHKMMIKAGLGPNLTTSEDMMLMLKKMYCAVLPGSHELLEIMQEQVDRSRIPLYIQNDVKISHKSGALEAALHEIGVVYSKNPFIFCFFSDDQKDKRLTNDVLSKSAKDCFDYSNQE